MFKFNEKTKANIHFKVSELLKTLNADKQIKEDSSVIDDIVLTNVLSPERTFMEGSDCIREIYIIEVILNSRVVPSLFIDAFNKYIEFQTLFKLIYQNEVKYLSSIKQFADNMKVLKKFETNWEKDEIKTFPITNKLENVFKEMISNISKLPFRTNENFNDYVLRFEKIKKLEAEIEKQTKTMNNEKQPNIRMALNDDIKILKKELRTLEKIDG